MGIYDRDYIRSQPPSRHMGSSRGGLPALRLLSVTAWLIIINCAVFVASAFTPTEYEIIGGPFLAPGVERIPTDARKGEPRIGAIPIEMPDGTTQDRRGVFQPIIDPATGRHLGFVQVTPMPGITRHLHFSTQKGFLELQFWRLIGFQFLHADLTHLLLNMIGLFFLGPIVESYLGRKRFLAFYLLAGICGALLYVFLNLMGIVTSMVGGFTIPGLLVDDPRIPLVGASAGVFGVLTAGAFLAPNAIFLLFFIIPVKLKWLAYGLVALAMFTLLTGGHNAGGEAGHLGGAIAGWYFIRRPHHLHNFFDFLGRADPTSHHYRRKSPTRRSNTRADGPKSQHRFEHEVDRILMKISDQGMASLTDKERETLRQAARRKR